MKTLGILIAGIFCVHVTMAQEQEVRVQSNQDIEQENFTSFYFLDETMDTETMQQSGEFDQQQDQMNNQGTVDQQQGTTDQQKEYGQDQQDQQLGHDQKTDELGQQDKQYNIDHQYGMTGFDKKEAIRSAVLHEMVRKGYKINAENPDLLVSYQVFDQSTEITGFTEDQGTITGTGTPSETVPVDEGTILITVVSRETGEMISRGFISGALSDLDKDDMMKDDKQEGQVMEGQSEDKVYKDKEHVKNYEKKADVIQAVANIFEELQIGDTGTLGAGR